MLWTAKIMSRSESLFWLAYFIATIPLHTKTNHRASSLTDQGGAHTWEICSVEQYQYKTDLNLNGGKGFTNGTKQVFVQNKFWWKVQKHKGSNATVCLDKLACFMLEQMCKTILLVIYGEQEFSFSTIAAHFKFPILFLLFLLILKHFQKVFKCFLAVYCLIWNVYYNITASLISVGRSNHDIFYFFSEKLLCSQSAGCYFETFYSIIIITLIK